MPPRTSHDTDHTYDYRVKGIRRVVDGDTFDFVLDLGFFITKVVRIRLKAIDTYEVYGPHASERGKLASEFARRWLTAPARDLRCQTYPDPESESPLPDGAFGRWLGDVYDVVTGTHLNDALRDAGHHDDGS